MIKYTLYADLSDGLGIVEWDTFYDYKELLKSVKNLINTRCFRGYSISIVSRSDAVDMFEKALKHERY